MDFEGFLLSAALGLAALAQPTVAAQSPQLANSGPPPAPRNVSGLPALPPAPTGTSTVVGGAIQTVDPVRDQLSLGVYGQRPMTIFYDERTQVFRDGVRVPLRDLRPESHASVETTLDGSRVFALSIHILSAQPKGEFEGRVLSYNPPTGDLAIASPISPLPVKLSVTRETSIQRVGQRDFVSQSSGPADLVTGALVSVTFASGQDRNGVAQQISILAVPGTAFMFSGNITYLDMPAGQLALVDPRDGKSYQIHFDPARLEESRNLQLGKYVTIRANYDGVQYVAQALNLN
jgi:hypothetical protein